MQQRTTRNRFDCQGYLDDFVQRGVYPDIHADLFALVAAELTGRSVLDLCCSTGILGAQIKARLGVHVVGVDSDRDAMTRGRAVFSHPMLELKITPATMPELEDFMKGYLVDTVVARRCFSELFRDDHGFGRGFGRAIAAAGVKELFLQGRQFTPKATHPIPSVQHEILLVADTFEPRIVRGECAYLVRK